jgi:Transposase, Mutator family
VQVPGGTLDQARFLRLQLSLSAVIEGAWRGLLDDPSSRGLSAPNFVVVIDGAAGLEKALGLVWSDALAQRCTMHKHRNTLARAPERLHEETSAEHNDMICASTPKETEAQNKSFIRKWRVKRSALPTAWPRPEIGCSPSPACPTASRDRHPLPMPSSAARGVQTPHQDANATALSGDSGDAVLGSASLRTDHHA